MAEQAPRRRRGKFVRFLMSAFGRERWLPYSYDIEPPTLNEQMDELLAAVADEESRWRRNLGSRRR
jgi:hypothetical protein